MPDIVTSAGLLQSIAQDRQLRLVHVCKEDECFGIAAGLAFRAKRALTRVKPTGLIDSIGAIRGVAIGSDQPICLMVGLLGRAEPIEAQ